jgi:hypothetical protein
MRVRERSLKWDVSRGAGRLERNEKGRIEAEMTQDEVVLGGEADVHRALHINGTRMPDKAGRASK